MEFTTVARKSSSRLFAAGLLAGIIVGTLGLALPAKAQTSIVGATVCQSASSISLAQPVSDSTVTQPSIPLAGTVDQANQIEVYIDGALDSIIPLTVGQTSFVGSVALSLGTHTIKVVAVNVCPGPNGQVSSVVTYEQPPNTSPSTGETTPTNVGSQQGGETVSTKGGELPSDSTNGEGTLFPKQLALPFQRFLGWLNINTGDTTESHGLSIWRAALVAGGLYLVVIGAATTAVQMVAGIPVITSILPSPTLSGRMKWVSWGFRFGGLLLVLGGLFL
jgi:hypothetical protein